MRILIIFSCAILFSACNLVKLLLVSEERNESKEEISQFLIRNNFKYDFSFELCDSLAKNLSSPRYRINEMDSMGYSYIQLRIFDSRGEFYTSYSQCLGSFDRRNFIRTLPVKKNNHPHLNKELKLVNEFEILDLDDESKDLISNHTRKFDLTFVVYWTIWTNHFSKRVLRQVSKIKKKYPDKVCVILVNSAK